MLPSANRAYALHVAAGLIAILLVESAVGQWPQWGGPDRNFTIETEGLADSWPEDGPRKMWHRELGDGCSSIIVDDGTLYTMYRQGEDEFTVALSAATGETLWEHGNPSPLTPNMAQYGPGPHATPLVVGDRLFTVGANIDLHCFEKKTGKVIWRHDLLEEYKLTVPSYGYACSPVAYKRTVILPVGGEGDFEQTLAAFDQVTGHVVWRSEPTNRSLSRQCEYSSPLIITFDGEDQLVFLTNERVAGFNPNDGTPLWEYAHANHTGVNVSMPVWVGEDSLFCSGAYDSGASLIKLKREDGKTVAERLWYSRKMRLHHANAVLIGDHVYGSGGDFGPAFFMAMNLKTGRPSWRKRGFRKATCVYGDGKLIILDEDGQLALATATPTDLVVHSRCKMTERISWTVPTLVGTTLYLRDRQHIMALDLR